MTHARNLTRTLLPTLALLACVVTATLASLLLPTVALAGEPPINTLERSGLFGYKPSGVAIRGFDTVAYFTDGKPTEGSDEFTTEWQGATWKFATQEHLDLFKNDPEAYAPQYGGYCAYGVATDSLVKIEGDLWTIIDDKLYLNYNEDFNEKWKQDIPSYIAEADGKFSGLLAD